MSRHVVSVCGSGPLRASRFRVATRVRIAGPRFDTGDAGMSDRSPRPAQLAVRLAALTEDSVLHALGPPRSVTDR